jgi:hypothetical protein
MLPPMIPAQLGVQETEATPPPIERTDALADCAAMQTKAAAATPTVRI